MRLARVRGGSRTPRQVLWRGLRARGVRWWWSRPALMGLSLEGPCPIVRTGGAGKRGRSGTLPRGGTLRNKPLRPIRAWRKSRPDRVGWG